MTRERRHDNQRARDLAGLVHWDEGPNSLLYECGLEIDVSHGVWRDEPTTCLWCVLRRKVPPRPWP